MKIKCCKCEKEIPSFEESITINDENICLQCYAKEKLEYSQDSLSEHCREFSSQQQEKSSSGIMKV